MSILFDSTSLSTHREIDCGWRYEANRRVAVEGLTFQKAMDTVALRYLLLGNARALLDGVLRGYWRPGVTLLRYISAMMLPEHQNHFHPRDLPFRLGIDFDKPRGRPPQKASPEGLEEQRRQGLSLARVHKAAAQMALGRPPRRWFWAWLSAELEPKSVSEGYKSNVLLEAGLIPLIPRMGRRIDPELSARTEVLGQMVARLRPQISIKVAVERVFKEIEQLAEREGWAGEIDRETIRQAYLAVSKTRKRMG